jgi:dUTP pyrophosphatase
MFNKFKNLKDSFSQLSELQESLKNMDSTDPQSFLNSMGIDYEELEKGFNSEYYKTPEIEYVYKSVNPEPKYHYGSDSGFDLRANEKVTLKPFERAMVPTGLHINVPTRHEVQVRPKSGLAFKKGLTVLNTPGTVDEGYTGEIKVILINLSQETQVIEFGDKIAQAVICPVVQGRDVILKRVQEIKDKDRNENGFGSTGN